MRHLAPSLLVILPLGLCLHLGTSCSRGPDPDPATGTVATGTGTPGPHTTSQAGIVVLDPSERFPDWKADFPKFSDPLHLSPPAGNRTYERSRQGILRQVAANLQGNCSREAWLLAKEFFLRHPDAALEILGEQLDVALSRPELAEVAENVLEVMTGLKNPEFAPPILRALEHPRPGVRNKAARALVSCGDQDSVRKAQSMFLQMEFRAQLDWVRAAVVHLDEEAPAVLGTLLAQPQMQPFHKTIVEESMKLGDARARVILEPYWPRAAGEERVAIAGLLHRTGDARGTLELRELMRGRSAPMRALAATMLAGQDVTALIDDLMALTGDLDPGVREAAVIALRSVPGENVDGQLTILAHDESEEVRQAALRALVQRGVRSHLDRIIESIRTASGYSLDRALTDAVHGRDAKAIPAIVERFEKAPPGDLRMLMSAIGRLRSPDGFPFLRKQFLADDQPLQGSRDLTRVQYAAVLMPNLDGAGPDMLALLKELPKEDYRRRAMLLTALGNYIGGREDAGLRRDVYDSYRGILLDPTEISQMRLLALEWLRRDLRVDDVLTLQRMMGEEKDGMRQALNNFLCDMF